MLVQEGAKDGRRVVVRHFHAATAKLAAEKHQSHLRGRRARACARQLLPRWVGRGGDIKLALNSH